jgi:hypothetical protein
MLQRSSEKARHCYLRAAAAKEKAALAVTLEERSITSKWKAVGCASLKAMSWRSVRRCSWHEPRAGAKNSAHTASGP